jgi:hypothetical protein
MELGVQIGAQLYMRVRRQCDNSFFEENMTFCFNHPRDPAEGLRSQQV